MAQDTGRLNADPLFLALTRPTMIVGVTYAWLMGGGGLASLYFINTSDFKGVFIYYPLWHFVGMLIFSREPRFLEIAAVWAKVYGKCKNRKYHGNTASYDLY